MTRPEVTYYPLVHDYIEIDRGIVFEVLHNRLGDLEELERLFASFL
jgi:uncharacterized protein YutE (UPF0331/DUF86 family)